MSEKDIKIKPQTTAKAVKNAPKSVQHSAETAVKDIKTVAKDTLPHEFGHYIQSVLPNHNIAADERLKNQLAKLKFTGDDYFMTSDTEFFAEAFAEYCKNGNRLKESCEAVYTYIDNALNTFSNLYQ